MTHRPETKPINLGFLTRLGHKRLAKLTPVEIEKIQLAIAHHNRNYIRKVSLPTNEREINNENN